MFIARNAPDLFNRGDPAWAVAFWDGRVLRRTDGSFVSPAGDALPAGLDGLLARPGALPMAAIVEMRGLAGDVDVLGRENDLALYDEYDFTGIWAAIVARLRAVPGYRDLLAAAYPGVPPEDYAIQHVANGLAAFQASAFAFTDSPWQRYLRGNDGALSDQARAGATLFFGEAGCWRCHNGPLLTDQRFHNVAAPQLGTGKREEAPYDFGRGRVTHDAAERYAFRTPSLHQVTLTGPWFHNGAYTTLEAAVRHVIAPVESLRAYDGAGLIAELRANLWDDPDTLAAVLSTLDPLAGSPVPLAEADVAALLVFLEALTDPAAADLAHLIPESVPSGLPVAD
jgi:cytochrome c peroxidase